MGCSGEGPWRRKATSLISASPLSRLSLGCSQFQKASKPTPGTFMGKLKAEGTLLGMVQVYSSNLITPFIQLKQTNKFTGHNNK